jgi:hypothetical protein
LGEILGLIVYAFHSFFNLFQPLLTIAGSDQGHAQIEPRDVFIFVKGVVRTAIRRSAFEITKGIEDKPEIIRSCETLLTRMDDEENYQKNVAPVQYRQGLQ